MRCKGRIKKYISTKIHQSCFLQTKKKWTKNGKAMINVTQEKTLVHFSRRRGEFLTKVEKVWGIVKCVIRQICDSFW